VILELLGWIALGYFTLMGSFVLVMRAKRMLKEGGELSLFWLVNILPWAVIGLALDIAFNATAGTIMYLETPRELLFTARCQRHVDDDDWRGNVARWWQRQLNQIDPGHV
jgi:hypothetical protein